MKLMDLLNENELQEGMYSVTVDLMGPMKVQVKSKYEKEAKKLVASKLQRGMRDVKKDKKINNYSLCQELIDFMNWFATYNMMPLGLVLKMSMGNNLSLIRKDDKDFEQTPKKVKKFELNQEQKKALKFLNFKNDKFDVSVLQGTTGSGKTLVYFERIKKIINKKKQALVLLPEIFLTNEFKSRFVDFFGFEPAIWHSKITPKNKRIIWKGIILSLIHI